MTPKQLDWIINGVPVYIYRRPIDGTLYPSILSYDRFGISSLATVRVPVVLVKSESDALNYPGVLEKISEISND